MSESINYENGQFCQCCRKLIPVDRSKKYYEILCKEHFEYQANVRIDKNLRGKNDKKSIFAL